MQNTHRRLHYVAFEAHPLTPVDWQRLAQQRPQPLFQDLAVAAPPLLSGWHRRSFAEGRIQLSVFHGDVLAGLQELRRANANRSTPGFLMALIHAKTPKCGNRTSLTLWPNALARAAGSVLLLPQAR